MSWSNLCHRSLPARRATHLSTRRTTASIWAACSNGTTPILTVDWGAWAEGFIRSNPTGTLALLADLNAGVGAWVSYQSREAEGTQTPIESLNRGWGSCRDLAMLLIEAARSLGFGARVVTGYLYNPSGGGHSTGAGTTHAWADIYVPGAGWVAYDPTNGTIGGGNLIRVAVTRDISQAVPVAGSFVGASDDYLGMTVEVLVAEQ